MCMRCAFRRAHCCNPFTSPELMWIAPLFANMFLRTIFHHTPLHGSAGSSFLGSSEAYDTICYKRIDVFVL